MRDPPTLDFTFFMRSTVSLSLSLSRSLSLSSSGPLLAATKVFMASVITASLPPPLILRGRKTLFWTFQKLPVSSTRERQNSAVIAKATSDSSKSSTSLSIVKSVQNVWGKSDEDRLALIGLGFAAIAALWASTNLISAVDKLPLIPNVLEFIGILVSSWFIYRYLLFKPDREELFQIINKSISEIFGQ